MSLIFSFCAVSIFAFFFAEETYGLDHCESRLPNSEPGCGSNCEKRCGTVFCPRIACLPWGCECKDGYYLHPDGRKCVRIEDCGNYCESPVRSMRNSEPGCGTNCGKRCDRSNECPSVCQEWGCECKPGYLLHPNGRMCVLPGFCRSK